MKPLNAVDVREAIQAFIEPDANAVKLESQLHKLGIPICRSWSAEAMLEAGAADILLCAIMHLDDVAICHVLEAMRQHNPLAPVLLITTYGRGNARELLNLPCDDVLFLDELTEPELACALERMRTLTCLRSVHELLSKNRFGIDEFISSVLARACRIPHPLRSVDEIAQLAGVHRSTLLRRWRASTPPGSRPHFFIDWLLVVHALLLKARQSSNWQTVAHRLGVKEQTIRSAAQRRFGATLNELHASDRSAVRVARARDMSARPEASWWNARCRPSVRQARWLASLLCLALLIMPRPLAGQALTGRLLDDATSAPVVDSRVELLGPDGLVVDWTLTTQDGSFALRASNAGQYKLRASHVAYATTVSPPVSLQHDLTLEVEFRLAPRAVPLAPLTVVSRRRDGPARDSRLERRGYYERKALYGKEGNGLGFAHFLDADEIRSTAFAVSDVLRGLSGIYVAAAGGRDIVVTGRRGCSLEFYLDGVPVGTSLDAMILPSAMIAVEVYTGRVMPAQFHRSILGSNCGAVVVWTGAHGQR